MRKTHPHDTCRTPVRVAHDDGRWERSRAGLPRESIAVDLTRRTDEAFVRAAAARQATGGS